MKPGHGGLTGGIVGGDQKHGNRGLLTDFAKLQHISRQVLHHDGKGRDWEWTSSFQWHKILVHGVADTHCTLQVAHDASAFLNFLFVFLCFSQVLYTGSIVFLVSSTFSFVRLALVRVALSLCTISISTTLRGGGGGGGAVVDLVHFVLAEYPVPESSATRILTVTRRLLLLF